MKALTVKQPWASLISSGFKIVENRTWPVPKTIRGERIAIHAGQGFDHIDYVAEYCACTHGQPYGGQCMVHDLLEYLGDDAIAAARSVAGRILCTAVVVGQITPGFDLFSDAEFFVEKPCRVCHGSGRFEDDFARKVEPFELVECNVCDGTGSDFAAESCMFADSGQYSWILSDVRLTYDVKSYKGKQYSATYQNIWNTTKAFKINQDNQ